MSDMGAEEVHKLLPLPLGKDGRDDSLPEDLVLKGLEVALRVNSFVPIFAI